jgi:signal transduction histidine kinase
MKAQPFLNSYTFNDPLEQALYILQDAIIILNRKKILTYINKAALEAVVKQQGKVLSIGDFYLDFVEDCRKERTIEQIEDAFCNQSSEFTLNYPQNGVDTWYQLGYYPMPDETGLVTHVCVRGKNITKQVLLEKELEDERIKLNNRLIKATIDAQERQRSEIGRELHDNVNQVLTTVKLYNELCLTEEYTNKNLLLRSVQQVNYCIETLRSLSKALESPKVEETSIKDSIKELVDEVNATKRIHTHFFTYGVQQEKISQDLLTSIYRIAQEQLTNVLKYANASRVDVILVGTSESIALKIQDDGIGFNLDVKSKGVGLTNMSSRAEALGGILEINTAPGQGCSIMVEFPLN